MGIGSRENVKTEVKGKKLIIEIDLEGGGEESGSKKNLIIASTGGNRPIALPDGGQITLGLNLYKPKPAGK